MHSGFLETNGKAKEHINDTQRVKRLFTAATHQRVRSGFHFWFWFPPLVWLRSFIFSGDRLGLLWFRASLPWVACGGMDGCRWCFPAVVVALSKASGGGFQGQDLGWALIVVFGILSLLGVVLVVYLDVLGPQVLHWVPSLCFVSNFWLETYSLSPNKLLVLRFKKKEAIYLLSKKGAIYLFGFLESQIIILSQ